MTKILKNYTLLTPLCECIILRKQFYYQVNCFPRLMIFKNYHILTLWYWENKQNLHSIVSWSKTHFCSLNYYAILTRWYNYYNFFFWQCIIYWMKETNSCFLRITSQAPIRIQQNLYTAFEWIWRSNLLNLIFSWQVLCEKMKIKVSSV